MDNFPVGTRVYYWNNAGNAVYATVEEVASKPDGTVVVTLQDDSGQKITLPAKSVTKAEA